MIAKPNDSLYLGFSVCFNKDNIEKTFEKEKRKGTMTFERCNFKKSFFFFQSLITLCLNTDILFQDRI